MLENNEKPAGNNAHQSSKVLDSHSLPEVMPRPRVEAPWIILAALLLATILAAHQSNVRSQKIATQTFDELATNASKYILSEVRHIEDEIAIAATVIASMPDIDNTRWNHYLDARGQNVESTMGLVRLEYRAVPKPVGKAAAAARPPPPSSLSRVIVEQLLNISELSTSPLIDDATKVAGQTRRNVTTPPLIIENAAKATDYVAMVSPVYSSNLPQGEAIGYMVAILRPARLLTAASAEGGQRLALAISENGVPLFDSASRAEPMSALSATLPLNIGQRNWSLSVAATSKLENELSSRMPATILFVGILGTLSLVGLVWLLTRLREQAATLANSMTLKLRDQVKFTDDLIELNPNPIFRKDADGRLVAVNRAWEQLNKRDRLDVLGKTSREFQAPLIADAEGNFDADVFASAGGFEAREAFVVDANGREIPTIVAKQVVRRADGTVDGIIGTVTDVTLVKQLEREVAKQQEQLDLVIRSSQQGILDVDFDPAGNQYYSERFREILGFGPDDLHQTLTWKDWIHPDDVELFHQQLLGHLHGQTPYLDVECRALRYRSGHMWLRIRGVAQFDNRNIAVRFVGSIVDVTERREAELKLIEANLRVMEAARAKEAFLATMSHEIRTPMNGVLGMTSLLADTELNDEQHDYIRLIRASGDTLLRLIDDVLDFSKIESGHMTLESVPVEVISLVEETFELVAEKAREKKLELVWDIGNDIPDYVIGDATRLRQILMNLLSNAIKFTEKGEITLAMKGEESDDGKVRLTVQVIDTGIGIPAERIQQLFQPFTQVDASTTRKYGGTGLGLAIVKRLVSLMGGEVSLASVEGQGSVFSFSILTIQAAGPQKRYMQKAVPEFLGRRLLLVDNNARRRVAAANRYLTWGLDVEAVAPAGAADLLGAAHRNNRAIDILVTDTLLPTVESIALKTAVEQEDARRLSAAQSKLSVVLMSYLSRAELAHLYGFAPLRHDMLVLRPSGRARMFDVLMRAATRQGNSDVATRPFTPSPVYETSFKTRGPESTLTGWPATQKIVVTKSTLPPDGNTDNTINILVAEDNEVNQRVIEGMIRRLGHRVTTVTDGQAAVDAVLKQQNGDDPFDIVLMDIHMPVLDGVGAMRVIKKAFHHADSAIRLPVIPIVAMTAHALAGDREHYLNEGMDDYISKPIRRKDLVSLLLRVVPRKATGNSGPQTPVLFTSIAQRVAVAAASNNDARADLNPPGEPAVPVLDVEQLEDLRGLPSGGIDGTESGANGLIELFKTKSRERLRLIASCLADGNWELLGDTAHSLRGASASVGFPRVAASCKDLEMAARQLTHKSGVPPTVAATPTRGQLDALYEQITRNFYEAEAALQHWLNDPPPTP